MRTAILLLASVLLVASEPSTTCFPAAGLAAAKKKAIPDVCSMFDGKRSCCSAHSAVLLRPTLAGYRFNFDKCVSCFDNWRAVLCNANCAVDQGAFVRQRGAGKATNFTLTIDPHLCTKLWHSCADEDTDEFEFLQVGRAGNSRTIRYVFQGINKETFKMLQKDAVKNATQWDESIFEDSAKEIQSQARGFGTAFLPSEISKQLMPSGAEEFCIAMGFRHSLGLRISMCEGEVCEYFPLSIEVGQEGCTNCLKASKLKENDPSFRGYEFCHTHGNAEEHVTTTAKNSIQFALFLLLSGTGANFIFQMHRSGAIARGCSMMSESLVYLLAGVMMGGVVVANGSSDPDRLNFDVQTFMFVLLPPIIFNEGFTINRRLFFANLNTILLLALLGTFITIFVIGNILLWVKGLASSAYLFPDLTTNEAFLYATVISAVDPVAVVSQFAALKVDPNVEILVVGESLVNDAVILVLFKIWKEAVMHEQSAEEFNYLSILYSFFMFCVCSVATGLFVGVASALYFKWNRFVENEDLEVVCFLLCGYCSFLLAEYAHFSGILSTLVCGCFMAAYTERNLRSFDEGSSRFSSSSKVIIKMFAAFANEIVFIMTGMASVVFYDSFFFFFSFLVLIMCLIARAVAVFPVVRLSRYIRREPITFPQAGMLWWAGLRGAIAVALSVDIPSRHRHTLTACTCFIVFFTVAVQGGSSRTVLKKLGIRTGVDHHQFLHEYQERFQATAGNCTKRIRLLCLDLDARLLTPLLTTWATGESVSDPSQCALKKGDSVKVVKEGSSKYGTKCVVTDPDWNGMVKVNLNGSTKSYVRHELHRVRAADVGRGFLNVAKRTAGGGGGGGGVVGAEAELQALREQVGELKLTVAGLRRSQADRLTAKSKRGCMGGVCAVLGDALCCVFSDTVSVGLFRLMSVLMAALAAALLGVSLAVLVGTEADANELAGISGSAHLSDFEQLQQLSRLGPVRVCATVVAAASAVVLTLSVYSCYATRARSRSSTRRRAIRGLALTVYSAVLACTFLANLGAAVAGLSWSHYLDRARSSDFVPSRYGAGEYQSVLSAQTRVHRETSALYKELGCTMGAAVGTNASSAGAREYEYVYKSATGTLLDDSSSAAAIQYLSLNVSCTGSTSADGGNGQKEGGGPWLAGFIRHKCLFAGNKAEWDEEYKQCREPFLDYISSSSSDGGADARSAERAREEGTEAYCICRAALATELARLSTLIGGLALGLALVQAVLLVGCIRLCMRGAPPPSPPKRKGKGDSKSKSKSNGKGKDVVLTQEELQSSPVSPQPAGRSIMRKVMKGGKQQGGRGGVRTVV